MRCWATIISAYFFFGGGGEGEGLLHLLPQISIFCALSQNNQHLLEKEYISYAPYSKLFKELKMAFEFIVVGIFYFLLIYLFFEVFKLGSKQSNCCLDQYLKNRLAYLNFDAILSSILWQFFIWLWKKWCIYNFLKRCW